jgi:hypothetical protein
MPTEGQEPIIRVVPMGTITIYHVSEDELRLIEAGGPSSVYLNFAIGLLSVGVSFGTNLALAEIKSLRVYLAFVVVNVISLLAGLVLLVLWRRESKASRTTIQTIRARAVPAPGTLAAESQVET